MSTDTTNANQATDSTCRLCSRPAPHHTLCRPCNDRIARYQQTIPAIVRRRNAASFFGDLSDLERKRATATHHATIADGEVIVRCPDCDGGGTPAEVDAHDCPRGDDA